MQRFARARQLFSASKSETIDILPKIPLTVSNIFTVTAKYPEHEPPPGTRTFRPREAADAKKPIIQTDALLEYETSGKKAALGRDVAF
jgi:hypothetical protein